MGNLPTAKKLDSKRSVDQQFRQVIDWTKKELQFLQKNSKSPICIKLDDGSYIVAEYKVEHINNACWRVGELEFLDKRSAIFYCALSHLQKFTEANQILNADQLVTRYDLAKRFYRIKLDTAHEANDQFKIDLYGSRFEESKHKLVIAKQELEKILATAKYNKNLGNHYET